MLYENVAIRVGDESLHGWWVPADPTQSFMVLPDEPSHILKEPKTMLYFCGVGNNMGDYNYLSRVAAFRQLGFSVLVFDYRGYGLSEGSFPSEAQLYEDAQAAWNYLRSEKEISAEEIVIYGESMGGAIALNLAIDHPEASSLIMQSSFTSMVEAIKHRPASRLFPIKLMLSEQFNSLEKISTVQMPVLFLHGSDDSVVPANMSQELYAAAPPPKEILIIPGAEHVSIYRVGSKSYLRAIQTFMNSERL